MLTDKEVKEWFEHRYNLYKDEPSYEKRPAELPECMVCGGCEVRVIWNCACGEDCATLDPDDPELEKRKLLFMNKGTYNVSTLLFNIAQYKRCISTLDRLWPVY